ncbi:MAG: hypothetical protein ACLTQI_06800 [Slackia sp.]
MGTPTRRPSTTRPRRRRGYDERRHESARHEHESACGERGVAFQDAIGGLREANHGQKRGEGAQKRTKQVGPLKDERPEGQSFVGSHVEQGEDEALVARKARDTAG